jgi:hypothetical protein
MFQILHWTGAGTLERDRKNALALLETFRNPTGEVSEEGVNCSQSNVPRRGLVCPVVFEMIEECKDEVWGQVIELDALKLPPVLRGNEAEQKREGVAVTQNGMGTDTSDARQMAGKKMLDGGSQGV